MEDDKPVVTYDNDKIEEIVIRMADGTERIIPKGMVAYVKEEEGNLSMEFANMSGKDVNDFVHIMLVGFAHMYKGGVGQEMSNDEEDI